MPGGQVGLHRGIRIARGSLLATEHGGLKLGGEARATLAPLPSGYAKSALEGQGFVVGRVDIQSDLAAGVVVATDPPPGTSVSIKTRAVPVQPSFAAVCNGVPPSLSRAVGACRPRLKFSRMPSAEATTMPPEVGGPMPQTQ